MSQRLSGAVILHYDANSERFRADGIAGLEWMNEQRAWLDEILRLGETWRKAHPNTDVPRLPVPAANTGRDELYHAANLWLNRRHYPTPPDHLKPWLTHYALLKKLLDKCRQQMQLAERLANAQRDFLLADLNPAHLKKLTYTELAQQTQWSESTCRRTVHTMQLNWHDHLFPADRLINASDMTVLCHHIAAIKRQHPNAGAPDIQRRLQQAGIEVSQRWVGQALAQLQRPQLSAMRGVLSDCL